MKETSVGIKKIYSICFLLLMLVLGLASIFLLFNKYLSNETTRKINTTVDVSFSQQYPFDEADVESLPSVQVKEGRLDKISNFINWATSTTETYLTTYTPISIPYKNLMNVLSNLYDRSVIIDGSSIIIKIPNGYLTECFDYCASPESQEHILDFSTWLNSQEIPFIVLMQPDKSDDSITVFPKGIPHGYTKMVDEYKSFLDDNAIKYIDAKPVLLAENDDLYSWFYKSDSHWNVHAAYKMADETTRVLNDELSIPTDTNALNNGNFELVVYPNSFLGKYGKQLGDEWTEDMEIYYPRKDTSFNVEIPGYDNLTGRFENALIDQSRLGTTDISYRVFLYGSHPLVRIENNICKNGTRVLVIKYSFADSMCPYLANTVQYLDVIDPRYFDGSIRSFITQTRPDAVILCMGVPTEADEKNLQLK